MQKRKHRVSLYTKLLYRLFFCALLSLCMISMQAQNFGFSKLDLNGAAIHHPTSLDFGPDGKLYVATEEGKIYVIEIERNAANDYVARNITVIHGIQQIPNHHEDGTAAPEISNRIVRGLIASGSLSNPVLYVSSYDPRPGVSGNGDMNLDTNSGIISKLTWNGDRWELVHLVRGLPRAKENQGSNGLFLDEQTRTLYVAQSGHTNAGAPSESFALSSEYALSAGILSIDLTVIEALPTKVDQEQQSYKYNLPTVKFPGEIGAGDISASHSPWGGLDGLNQAKLIAGGPVQVYAPGFRNSYDLLISSEGFMYATDNGANSALGGLPEGEGSPVFDGHRYISGINNRLAAPSAGAQGNPTARMSTSPEIETENSLHLVTSGYYGGHPNPIRANPKGAGLYLEGGFHRTDSKRLPQAWPPVDPALANPIEGQFLAPQASQNGVLLTLPGKLKGITEYTASNFKGAMKGDILIATFEKTGIISRMTPSTLTGTASHSQTLSSGIGDGAIDLVALGDKERFPGTIWTAIYNEDKITILEPADFQGNMMRECKKEANALLDDDGDGFSNADEMDPRNGTDPCSVESFPQDRDGSLIRGFKVSDWNDPDDDDDGIPDLLDPFVLDPSNGGRLNTQKLPVHFSFEKKDAGHGPFSMGMTGIMVNGTRDYLSLQGSLDHQFDNNGNKSYRIIKSSASSPYKDTNADNSSYQLGMDLCDAQEPVWLRTQIAGPFFNGGSAKEYLQGMYIGTGDQDNYLLLAINGDGKGGAGIKVLEEIDGEPSERFFPVKALLSEKRINLYWELNIADKTAQAYYTKGGGDDLIPVGPTILLSGKTAKALNCTYTIEGQPSYLALGLMANSGRELPFSATFDFVEIYTDRQACALQADQVSIDFQAITENTSKTERIELNHPLMTSLDISHVEIVGKDAEMFSTKQWSFVDVTAEKPANLEVCFNPKSSGRKEATLKVYNACNNVPLEIPLTGIGATFSEVLYRVNVGGKELQANDGGMNWQSDEADLPTSLVSKGGNKLIRGTSQDNLSYHASVPSGTPPEIFEMGRTNVASTKQMNWSFPLNAPAGTWYQVCLYAVNSCSCTAEPGQNVFNLSIEGKEVGHQLDIAQDFGHQTAATLCYPVQVDKNGSLDISFEGSVGSPSIYGIEIRGTDEVVGSKGVVFQGFHAQITGKNVTLDWSTSSEKNNQGFIIQVLQERDGSAALFQDLGFVQGRGSSNRSTGYTYEIENLVPDSYVFRLKQLNEQGAYTYSDRVQVSIKPDVLGLYTYPNPTKGILNVTLSLQSKQSVSLVLYDVNGRRIRGLFNDTIKAGTHKLGFNIGGLPNGIYTLEASNGQLKQVSKVILSK